MEVAHGHAKAALDRVLSRCNLEGVISESNLRKGNAPHVISELIDARKPSLVVLGATVRKGPLSGLLGATAESVVIRKATSALIVK